MKFELKDYQIEAVRDVLNRLQDAREDWHRARPRRSAFSLTAVTGAGKTVMAAAAFEALFHGDDETFDFDRDPGAVVIWFSDDPSLNEQTRFRLVEASDRLNPSDMVVVDNTFNRERFEPGKIYFLNTQKLGRKSLLTRGHDPEGPEGQFPAIRPDLRSHSIWDTIRNTVEDPELTLYLVLDEAHRGMGATAAAQDAKSTIVKRLINGSGGVPAIPVVWGISATVDRFNKAMAGAEGRTTLPNVVVDPEQVQESGLLKDAIILDVPDETGAFRTVLVRRAAQKTREISQAWVDYAKAQGEGTTVKPLMVLQIENTPNPNEIGEAIDTVLEYWPELESGAVAHVFGDHTTQTFGRHSVPYISPERVQESDWIRVLIAKDAISTGWDCPRAEVMVSFRPAKDPTHITQLLGRMVRSPLARRIPGNERLNAVDCLLPFFDTKSVTAVAETLMRGGSEGGESSAPVRRVLINPMEMTPNPSVPEQVWETFSSLPSQSLPQKQAKPVKRLTALAHELSVDRLKPDAGKAAHAEMHKALDAAAARLADEIKAARATVLEVEGKTLTADLRKGRSTFNDFVEAADMAVIDDAYRRAAREIGPDLAKSYVEHLARKATEADDPIEALVDARTEVAALGLVPEVKTRLEAEADNLAKTWFEDHRVDFRSLSDERQEIYRQVKRMSAEPQPIDLVRPSSWMEPTTAYEANGAETPLPTFKHHLMCGPDGTYPTEPNGPEGEVLAKEMARDGFVAWYRNPSRSQESLGVAYEDGERFKIMRPDFIFFARKADGTIVADIVDPHGSYLGDALAKLRGLARYAEIHGERFRRIESLDKIDGALRVLDLQDPAVRHAVAEATDAKALYASGASSAY